LKDEELEEKNGKYKELRQWSELGNAFHGNFDETRGENSKDIKEADMWSDPSYPQFYFQNNIPNIFEQNNANQKIDIDLLSGRQGGQIEVLKDLGESIEKDALKTLQITQERDQENLESMNASLLTSSDTKEMASAIGSMHKITEIKRLRIDSEKPSFRIKQLSPLFNKWIAREEGEKEKKVHQEENWLSLEKETEKRLPHEGSFCMRCWENPIYGPKYTCLICEYVEYCEKCVPKITHCHPLTKIREPLASENDSKGKFLPHQADEQISLSDDFKFKTKEINYSNESDELNKSLEKSLNLWTYQPVEEQPEMFKFEYKEISSTPLSIKSNQREWCLIYKTVCLKNTGQLRWERCHLEPVGEVAGTMTEVSFVAPDDSVLLTLEIHGFFTPGKYTSTWRVVHQGEDDVVSEMGCLELDFEILENRDLPLLNDMDYELDYRRSNFMKQKEDNWEF